MSHRITQKIAELIETTINQGDYKDEISFELIFVPQQEGPPGLMVYFMIPGAVLGSQMALMAQGDIPMMLNEDNIKMMIKQLYEQAQQMRSQQLAASNGNNGKPNTLYVPGQ